MVPAVVCPVFGLAVFVPGKGGCRLLALRDSETLESEAHLLKALTQAMDDMEAVDDDGRLGEAFLRYAEHRVAEVHGYLCDPFTLGFGNLLDDGGYGRSFGALDYRDDAAFPSMPVLVGKYGVDFSAE